jgi:glutamate/tyrosine decarboxylase-like PLP-dependent enzyme
MNSATYITQRLQYALDKIPKNSKVEELISQLLAEAQLHQDSAWSAHMTPAASDSALLGKLIAALHNGNLLSADLYPQLANIEIKLINWFCLVFKQKHGHFTHGSSYGNLEALWQARERRQSGTNIVYGSIAAHYSIAKACRILGLDFRPINTNQSGEININELKEACRQSPPLAIVATAGTSSCGAIDSLTHCIEIAQSVNSWCHIDAAWGGALALLEGHNYLAGIERADSLCFDPHKALGQTKPSSILFYQHELEPFTDLEVDYLSLTPKKTISGSYGGELFLPLWLSIELELDPLIEKIKARLHQAALFAQTLQKNTNWAIWHSPTGIVCFEPSMALDLSLLIKKGIFSQAKVDGRHVYRAVFANASTTSKQLITELSVYF